MARGMRIMTMFITAEEMSAIMEAAAAAGLKPYAWARKAVVAATKSAAPTQPETVSDPQGRLPTLEEVAALVTEPRKRSAVLDDLVSDVGITREQAGLLVEEAVQKGFLKGEVRDGRSWLIPATIS